MRTLSAACRLRPPHYPEACAALAGEAPRTDAEARLFFEHRFRIEAIRTEGLLTAYFTPVYPALHAPQETMDAPVRPPPRDPVLAGQDRAAIEAAPTDGALAWMKPEALFMLQVQGSGVLEFDDDVRVKAVFAGSNNKPFVPIGRVMRDQGLLAPGQTSATAIEAWLAEHRGPDAKAVMDLNPRYVFFRLEPDDGALPKGAAGVAMPHRRGVAADPAFHPLGELLWIDASDPRLAGAQPSYREIVAALDVGSAIKGEARADLYLGEGEAAGREAGRVSHRLTLYRLVPK
jgi:membrane-bound lytic murein transglycosylase A